MSKFTCLVLCVVAASLSSVHVAEGETIRDTLKPVIDACSKDHGVTDADIEEAKEAGSTASIDPCFLSCVFKKTGLLNDQGQYDLDTGLKNIREFVKDDEQYNKVADAAKKCSTVNDKPVSDGTAGCEKSVLLAVCFLEHHTTILN